MSNLVFPSPSPPNWSWRYAIKKSPLYKTIVQTPASGLGELRVPLYNYPRWQYEFDISYIKGSFIDPSSALEQIAGFYMAVQGMADDWLLDESDFDGDGSVSNAQFGTGDGETLSFQLTRQIGSGPSTPTGSGTDIIQDLNGTPQIYVGGILQATNTYTLGSTGIVTFGTAPSEGVALNWNGAFYRRCRFLEDTLDALELDLYQIWSLHQLKFISDILASPVFVPPPQSPMFSDEEVPSGAINGSNTTFTLANAPNPSASLQLFLNGVLQAQGAGEDYTLSGSTITFTVAPSTGDLLLCWYRFS